MKTHSIRRISILMCFAALLLGCFEAPKKNDERKNAIGSTVPVVTEEPKTADVQDTKDSKKEDETVAGVAFRFDYFEKTWGIITKKITIEPQKKGAKAHVLLEFTQDLPDTFTLKKAFAVDLSRPPIQYHFFDADNVSLWITGHEEVTGTLSGKKGEAFRIAIELGSVSQKVKKVEARPHEPNQN